MSAVVVSLAALALAPRRARCVAEDLDEAFSPSARADDDRGRDRRDQAARRPARGRCSGRTLGWLDTPKRRSDLLVIWNGPLDAQKVPDGFYRVQLVADGGGRRDRGLPARRHPGAAREPARVASNRGRSPATRRCSRPSVAEPRRRPRLRAQSAFDLTEPARSPSTCSAPTAVDRLDLTRTWTLRRGLALDRLGAGDDASPPRTYVLSLTTHGRRRATCSPTARPIRTSKRYPAAPVVRVMGIDAAVDAGRATRPARSGGAADLDRRADALDPGADSPGPSSSSPTPTTCSTAIADTEPVESRLGAACGTRRTRSRGDRRRLAERASTSSGSTAAGRDASATRRSSSGRRALGARRASPSSCRRTPGRPTTSGTRTATAGATRGTRGCPNRASPLIRPFLRRGVPPFFYRYDQGFLHWLYWTGKHGRLPRRERPRRALRRRPRPRPTT